MKVSFYQAECGDAARLEYIGNDGRRHNIFIDSGFSRTFQQVLFDEISTIQKDDNKIDLWIISHIHDDHIGGALSYVNSISNGELKECVKKWLYNFPRFPKSAVSTISNPMISTAKSISQGDDLAKYIISNKTITDATSDSTSFDIHGLKITIISPNTKKLDCLRKKYSLGDKQFERIEGDSVSEAKAAVSYDYNIPITKFDLSKWEEDDSIENGSSISIITELEGKKILWLADSHPSVIVESLEKLGFSKTNPLNCDIVKVSHHGSRFNNSNELFDMIRCYKYLFSANGENTACLPTKECMARILLNKNRCNDLPYKFYLTYDNSLLRKIFMVDELTIYEELNFSVHYSNAKAVVFNL